MSCCGQKREALQTGSANARAQINFRATPSRATKAPLSIEMGSALLRYLGAGTISLRGAYTGRVYYFAEKGNPTVVHPDDVDALLRTRLFAREGR